MTTLDTLSTARPDPGEVADAALAMADFDAKGGNFGSALEWLGVAAHHRELTSEYQDKRRIWEDGRSATMTDATAGPHVCRDA